MQCIAVVIPAYNEEQSLPRVLADIPDIVAEVVVADNNSRDRTADVAREAGATVVPAPVQGYGSACLAALKYLAELPAERRPDIVVFLDADYSDHPEQLPMLVDPIIAGDADLVIGSRTRKRQPAGALLPHQVFGNLLSCTLIRILWQTSFTDLGPFRAVSWRALQEMRMADPNFGWTVEMQVKAAKLKLRCHEVAVDYRPRIGVSKISGTLRGTWLAGTKILYTIFRELL